MRHEWVLSLFCKLIGMPWEHCLQLNFNHIYHLSEQPLPSECPWVVFRYNDLCTESTCYVYHWYTSPAASHHLTRTHTDKDKVMNDNTLMHSRQSAQTPHKRSNCTVALLETASQGMSAAVGTDPSCIAQNSPCVGGNAGGIAFRHCSLGKHLQRVQPLSAVRHFSSVQYRNMKRIQCSLSLSLSLSIKKARRYWKGWARPDSSALKPVYHWFHQSRAGNRPLAFQKRNARNGKQRHSSWIRCWHTTSTRRVVRFQADALSRQQACRAKAHGLLRWILSAQKVGRLWFRKWHEGFVPTASTHESKIYGFAPLHA